MKTSILKGAVAVTAASLMGLGAPLSAMAQSYTDTQGYWASDGRYYYYSTPTQTQTTRPAPFTTPAPVYNDYLVRARAQADADYQRDLAAWQAQRDANARAQADWDARYYSYNDYNNYDYNASSYPYPGAPAPSNNANCAQQRTNNTTTGGILGALVGAAIGSNLAARNTRTEGAVLGGVVGAALGANIGRATAACDDRGYYYTYDQTVPYNEPAAYRGRNSGRYNYDYYNRQGCRLAPAQYQTNDYRYVRVCPDSQGRYRITD